MHCGFAQIAQSVEQRTENPRVTGSIPVLGTYNNYFMCASGSVVERLLAKEKVAGSIPVSRFLCRKGSRYGCLFALKEPTKCLNVNLVC